MVRGLEARRADAVGLRLGPYVLRRWLAQGGMAELYLAHRAGAPHGPVLAIKKILPQYAQDLHFARMFAREAEVALRLHHPNCVAVYDSGRTEEGDFYLAMEFVHGSDLSRVLAALRERKATVPLPVALTIAIGMCAGLHHAHEQVGDDGQPLGIVHRDVSPSNVMVGYDGSVKITDFGVAKALALTSFTQAGTRKGKLSYMSPEQARADAIDRRSDVFAIGVVLFELTTGQRLFSGDNELAIMHQLLFQGPRRPREVAAGYPDALDEIVMRAVAPDPSQRFSTALELQRALEAFAYQTGQVGSTAQLGALVAELVPGAPHPATDPSFFQQGVASAREDLATAVDQPTSGTFPSYGARTDASAGGIGDGAAATVAIGAPASVPAPGFSGVAPAHPMTQVQHATGLHRGPRTGTPWGWIAGIGSAVAIVGVATSLWIALGQGEGSDPEAGTREDPASASPSMQAPSPSAPAASAPLPAAGTPTQPAAPVQPATPVQTPPDDAPAPTRATDASASPSKPSPHSQAPRRRRAPKAAPDTSKPQPSKTERPPPPPPPPADSKRTKKSPTDTLLPILEE